MALIGFMGSFEAMASCGGSVSANTRCVPLDDEPTQNSSSASETFARFSSQISQKTPEEICDARIQVKDYVDIAKGYAPSIDVLAQEASNLRAQAMEKCVDLVVTLRNNRMKSIEGGCQDYDTAIREQCFIPRSRIVKEKRQLNMELDQLTVELEALESSIRAELDALMLARQNENSAGEGLTVNASKYNNFNNEHSAKQIKYKEIQEKIKGLLTQEKKISGQCENIADRYDDICVSQDTVEVEADPNQTQANGQYFQAKMTEPVVGQDAVIHVPIAERVIQEAGRTSQTVVNQESEVRVMYSQTDTSAQTRFQSTEALLVAFANQIGVDRTQNSNGNLDLRDEEPDPIPIPRPRPKSAPITSDQPPTRQPNDGLAFGGGPTHTDAETGADASTGSGAMSKTGSSGNGFTFPNLGLSSFNPQRTATSTDFTGSYNGRSGRVNAGYGGGRVSPGAYAQPDLNGHLGGGTSSRHSNNASTNAPVNVVNPNAAHSDRAKNNSSGGGLLSTLKDILTGNNKDSASRGANAGTARKSGHKQLLSSRNEQSGRSGILSTSSKSVNLQDRMDQLKNDRRLASADEFDPDKYIPKTLAEKRALARAAGKLGEHATGRSWPKDIYRHKVGTNVDVFHYMNAQFQRQFSE